jgi:hypothetical protein
MRKFLVTWLVVIPLSLIFVIFAVANRHLVTVSFDPFNSTDPLVAIKLPLLRLRHWRRAARQHEADAAATRAQLADLRASTSRGEPRRFAALTHGSVPAVGERDRQGATL